MNGGDIEMKRRTRRGLQYLPAQGVEPHYRPVVRAERADRVGQDLLEGQQDLVV